MKNIVQLSLVLLCLAANVTAELSITRCDGASLTWTNSVSNGTYRVLMTRTLTSTWEEVSVVTNILSVPVSPSDSPLFYQVQWTDAPPVVYTNFDTSIGSTPRTYLDLNGDGEWDVRLYQEDLTSLDNNGSEFVQIIYVMAHALCTSPFKGGQDVRMDLSQHSWVPSPQYQGVVLGQRHNRTEGPWDGPWYSATNAYMPVQFLISNSVHLGWVNLSPSTNLNAWRIHWGAYRPAPETMLKTGH